MCSALLYVFRKFCARCFRFRSRVFLACHVFSFLLSSLSSFRSRVLVLCHMFPFACGHVFYFTYGVFFSASSPDFFHTSLFYSSLCFVSSVTCLFCTCLFVLICYSSPAREFARAYISHIFLLFYLFTFSFHTPVLSWRPGVW